MQWLCRCRCTKLVWLTNIRGQWQLRLSHTVYGWRSIIGIGGKVAAPVMIVMLPMEEGALLPAGVGTGVLDSWWLYQLEKMQSSYLVQQRVWNWCWSAKACQNVLPKLSPYCNAWCTFLCNDASAANIMDFHNVLHYAQHPYCYILHVAHSSLLCRFIGWWMIFPVLLQIWRRLLISVEVHIACIVSLRFCCGGLLQLLV